jgi:hypothetical protein
VIALPPLFTGAVHATVADCTPAVALTPVGAPGGPAVGVTAFDCADTGPDPAALEACTVNVYEVPTVSPATVVDVVVPETVIAD